MGNGNATTTRRTDSGGAPTPASPAMFRVYFQRVPGVAVRESVRSVGAEAFSFHGSEYETDVTGHLSARGSLEAYECDEMRLTVLGETFEIWLENQELQPRDSTAGIKQRLQLLGYYVEIGDTVEVLIEDESEALEVREAEFESALLSFAADENLLTGRAPRLEINERLLNALDTAVANSWPSHT